jgi:hypothetical protein
VVPLDCLVFVRSFGISFTIYLDDFSNFWSCKKLRKSFFMFF